MKRVRVTNKRGQTFGADLDDPTAWINEQVMVQSWGKPERIVGKDPVTYDASDVIEEIPQIGTPATGDAPASEDYKPAQVRLKAEYAVDIQDVTAERDAARVARNARRAIGRVLDGAGAPTAAQQKAILKHLWGALFPDTQDET